MKYEAYRLRYFLTPFKCCPHTRQCCCLMPFGKHLYSLKCSTMRRTWDAVEILLSSFIPSKLLTKDVLRAILCSSSFIIVILLYCFSCCGISFTCIFLFFAAGVLPESILLYSSLYIFQVPIHPNTEPVSNEIKEYNLVPE